MASSSQLERAWRGKEEGGTCDKRYHRDGVLCCIRYSPLSGGVPSRPRALTRSQSQRMVGPLKGLKEESQQIDRSSHRLAKSSPC